MSTVENSEIIKYPDFLDNKEFYLPIVESILKQSQNDFQIESIKVNLGSSKGDNYLSSIYRVSLEVLNLKNNHELTVLSIIIKVKSSPYMSNEEVDKFNAFPKENEMYLKLIPEFERILHHNGVDTVFGPKCYLVADKPMHCLVFEDLNAKGYQMMNRLEGFTIAQIEQIFIKLARFHAVSAVYYEGNGPYDDIFAEGIYKDALRESFRSYYDQMYKKLLKALQSPQFDQIFYNKIIKWKTKIFDNTQKMARSNPKGFNVLNHGDLWINNIMCSKNDVLFIDYQMGVWAPPAIDILYMLVICCPSEILDEKFNYFIKFYYENLVATLETLHYDKERIPTLESIHNDLKERGFYGAMLMIEALPTIKLDSKEFTDDSLYSVESEDSDKFKQLMFDNPRFLNILKNLLPFFEKHGYLDINE